MLPLFDIRQNVIAGYLTDVENQRALRDFASSPEGRKIVENYLNSPEGPKIIRVLMPLILDRIDVAKETKESVLRAVEAKK